MMGLMILIIILIVTNALHLRIRCSHQTIAKIIKELAKQRTKNNTVVLAKAIPIVVNKTGFPEELVHKCLGITS